MYICEKHHIFILILFISTHKYVLCIVSYIKETCEFWFNIKPIILDHDYELEAL